MGTKLKVAKAVVGDVAAAETAIRDSGIKSAITSTKSLAENCSPNLLLRAPEFTNALSKIRVNFSKLPGVTSLDDLRNLLIEARGRLNKTKVTVDDWLGKAFEILGRNSRT